MIKRPKLLTSREEFPACIRKFDCIKGIAIGGCVDDFIDDEHEAHAHNSKGYEDYGWICLQYKYSLRNKLLLLHEVAHLIAHDRQHDDVWKNALVNIGGTYKPYIVKHNAEWFAMHGYNKNGRAYLPSTFMFNGSCWTRKGKNKNE